MGSAASTEMTLPTAHDEAIGGDATVVLRAEQITKVFPGTLALDHVDFNVYRGKVNALIGENGAGKSTLMKIVAGVERPTSGRLLLDGKPIQLRSPLHAEQSRHRHHLSGDESLPEPERGREYLPGPRAGADRGGRRPEGAARADARS